MHYQSTELCKTYRCCGLSHVTQFSLVFTFRGNAPPVSSVLSGFCTEPGDITRHRNIKTLPKHTTSRAGSCSYNGYKAEPSTCSSLVFSRHTAPKFHSLERVTAIQFPSEVGGFFSLPFSAA